MAIGSFILFIKKEKNYLEKEQNWKQLTSEFQRDQTKLCLQVDEETNKADL